MPDLLLELRSEEIPARMQRKAAGDLRKMVADGLVEAGLTYEAAREYWTPRRLTLDLRGLTARSKDVHEERKGPSTKAPEQAIQGFLRAAGLADISEAHIHSDPKKGDFYVAHLSKPGRAAEEIIAELIPAVIRAFPWPKSMRWGPASARPGSLRWVRPLQSIVCTFGPETEEPVVVDFEIDGIRSGNVTYGHRFHAPGAIKVRRFEDYAAKLEAAKVVIDADRRKEIILSDAKNLAFANGLELVEDEGLLEEVSGLVEWPVVLMGEFERDFLAIPPEVIRLTIRANQKCFVTRPLGVPTPDLRSDPPLTGEGKPAASLSSPSGGEVDGRSPAGGEGKPLSNHFLLTANIEAKDGGNEIAHGNGKVVRARLSDALYFWKTDQGDLPDLGELRESAEKFGLDLKKPLDQRMARLDHLNVTFHAKLGTQGERVERIARLAEELAPIVARSMAPSSGPSGHLLPVGEKSEAAMSATSSPRRGEGGSRSEPGEGEISQLARRAAVLAKADLTTEIVGEFPELQGAMGRKYALLQGEHPSVAAAIEEHYKPQGPSDRVPTDPVSVAVALADKLDTLVGFWAIDEKPTGSKDPYALRRAALGVVRLVLENGVRLDLTSLFETAALSYLLYSAFRPPRDHLHGGYNEIVGERSNQTGTVTGGPWHEYPYRHYLNYDGFIDRLGGAAGAAELGVPELLDDFDEQTAYDALKELQARVADMASMVGVLDFVDDWFEKDGFRGFYLSRNYRNELWIGAGRSIGADLLSFFHDRLKVYLRDQGARHDLIDAVLSNAPSSGPAGHLLPVGEKSQAAMSAASSPRRGEGGSRSEPGEGDMMPQPQQPYDVEAGHEAPHLPLAGGGRAVGAGGGVDADPATAGHPTPPLRADPPPQGEGDGRANDDLLQIVRRVEALGSFLATDEGKNLLAGTKRAANILAAEEKKKTAVAATVDPALFRVPIEETLYAAVNQAERQAGQAIQNEDFSAAMLALSALREPVDSFFEQVLVNDEDLAVRANRLALLSRIRAATDQVADFSKISG